MPSSSSSPQLARLDQLLASRGYCSRSRVAQAIRRGLVTSSIQQFLKPDSKVEAKDILFEGEPLDPPLLFLALNKPAGYVCTHADEGRSIYELLPLRYGCRHPQLTSVGRLDQDASGLLLLTDDGQLLHRLSSPRAHVAKEYEVELAEDLRGDETEIFASGELMLRSESKALLPATLKVLGPKIARIEIVEGRYHQVKRMFAAVGNKVVNLRRVRIGKLELGDLAEGAYRTVDLGDVLGT